MADTVGVQLGTTNTTIYTTPATKEATVLFCSIANKHASNEVDVDLLWRDSSSTPRILWSGTVPNGASMVALAGLVLEQNQSLIGKAGTSSSVDVVLSVDV